MTPTFIKSFLAAADIPARRLVAFSAGTTTVVPAAAATDPIIGVSDHLAVVAGGMADVIQGGWGEVVAGGAIAPGDPITSDAEGRAIKAEPVAGAVVRVAGFAQSDAALGDVIDYLVAPGVLATPAA
ncbi:MAG TPA: DUF2190 family protein [Hyphomicrobiales bacterium]|nr:DUF2190 family protein [Kaistiaceae bacterium]HQF31503.1 DUF2190 family protein [Hyphomicrobiales bacterium]